MLRSAASTTRRNLGVRQNGVVGRASRHSSPRRVSVDDRLVVLVTGCSSGFGRLMVEPLARAGYRVYASLRDGSPRNLEAQRELSGLSSVRGLSVRVMEIDLTSTAQVTRAVAAIEKEAGRID